MNEQLIEAVVKTGTLMALRMTTEQTAAFVEALSKYPLEDALKALHAVAMTEDRLTMAKLNKHLQAQDGRPSVDQAWYLMPKDEYVSAVVTPEMSQSWAACSAQYYGGDKKNAEIAFKREYKSLLEAARTSGMPCDWTFSPGFDIQNRNLVAMESALNKHISVDDAMMYITCEDTKTELVKMAQAGNLLSKNEALLLMPPEQDKENQAKIRGKLASALKLLKA